ncbi:MAG TPA: hypothetical protein P5137_08705 [Candidatus Brocadiia bacterium]|nr:hypothetical protein [Candidatus Brocadiia bacterium]
MPDAQTSTTLAWKKYIVAAGVVLALLIIHLAWEVRTQTYCNRLVNELETPQWAEAKAKLIAMGKTGLPYAARAFYYAEDPVVRRRAGETMLATLTELVKGQTRPSAEDCQRWEAWIKAEDLKPNLTRRELVARAREAKDTEIRRIAPVMNAWLVWQEKAQTAAESEMVSKALGDEDPECRALAAKMVDILGFANPVEKDRWRRATMMEWLLAELAKSAGDKDALAKIKADWLAEKGVGDFGNSVLVGLMRDAKDEKLRVAAAGILEETLAAAYRADDREELVRLVGRRRLRALLTMLLRPDAAELKVKRVLTLSPNIPPALVDGIRAELAKAQKEGPNAFQAELSRLTDIFASLEEGQKGLLKTKAVMALIDAGSGK